MMEVTDFNHRHGFRGGCVSKDLCVLNEQSLIGRRSNSNLKMYCCTEDNCNIQGLNTDVTTIKMTTVTPKHTTVCADDHVISCHEPHRHCDEESHMIHCRHSCGLCCAVVLLVGIVSAEICADVDSTACYLLNAKNPNLCHDPSLSVVCKRHCGQCPVVCNSCPHLVQNPNECNGTVTCGENEVCYMMEVMDFNYRHGFRGGCINKDVLKQQEHKRVSTGTVNDENEREIKREKRRAKRRKMKEMEERKRWKNISLKKKNVLNKE
ncbi:hypothetical protein CHS0354_040895 [Potamilus streckersoni]|uniref:Uncharacterized protein n=1 Tax=Potamilus streckersoni TaxID=2493646 RepID=A0AAE0VXU7_9BIVA|nr:hypothetical protein CHS0354_040895 [Potamilus streckersoni]